MHIMWSIKPQVRHRRIVRRQLLDMIHSVPHRLVAAMGIRQRLRLDIGVGGEDIWVPDLDDQIIDT